MRWTQRRRRLRQRCRLRLAHFPFGLESAKEISGNLSRLGMSRDLQSKSAFVVFGDELTKKTSQCFLVTCVVSSSHSVSARSLGRPGHILHRSGYPMPSNPPFSRAHRFLQVAARSTLHVDDRMRSRSHPSRLSWRYSERNSVRTGSCRTT